MLPQNRHALYARCGAVLADTLELLGFRHLVLLVLLVTVLARRAEIVAPHDPEPDFVPAPSAPAVLTEVAQEVKILHSHSQSLNFAPPTVAAALARRAKNFARLLRWRNFLPTEVAAGLMQRAKNLNWSIRWRNFSPAKFVSSLAHRASNPHKTRRSRNL